MKQDDILATARERYNHSYEEDFWNREQALDDLEFLAGEQWPEDVRLDRETNNRPILTINRMPQFLRQVTGDIRKTNPALSVSPADGEADKDIAELYDGLIRHIEHVSDAKSVYEQSAESAASCGMGWFRVLSDYEPGTFEQSLRIERIPNPFAVYCDPDARDPTRSDARYMFVVERMDTEQFEAAYPDVQVSSWESTGQPEFLTHWFDGDHVLVAEYFWKEEVTRTIGQLADGRVIDMAEPGAVLRQPVRVREVQDHVVHWCKLSGQQVLEEPMTLPCRYIPIVAVLGEELNIGERIVRSSVIRYAKDAQRLYNYWRSAQTELIALQPKAPYLVTPKQIEKLESYWESANVSNKPFLPYNPDAQATPPQRMTPPVPAAGMMQEIALAADDMKATTGIYDAALGERSNETSGVGIAQRQLESDISTSIYVDNLAKSISHCGRILVEMIPKIYDTTRQIRIIGADEAEKIVAINEPMQTPYGAVYLNDLSLGSYDVRITTGPSYSTRRQEAANAQIEFIRAVPSVSQYVMDLIARNMDWPGADQFADRLEKLLPPGVMDRDPSEMNEEERAQYEAEQAQAMQAQQLQQQQVMSELMKGQAEAQEAVAQAEEAQYDAALKGLELAANRGAIKQEAAFEVMAALQALRGAEATF